MPLEQVEDVRNAITFLSSQAEVDSERVGLHGTSFGGANAVYAAALDDRARCVVAAVSVGNGERWLRSLRPNWEWILFQRRLFADRERRVRTGQSEIVNPDEVMPPDPETEDRHRDLLREFPEREFRLPLDSAAAIIEYRPEEVVHRIAPRPVLFIQVEDDGLVANDISRELFERCGEPKQLVALPGMRHHSIAGGEAQRLMMSHALAWSSRHLPARAGPRVTSGSA
jgi:pimeloyl-ACP methyl ester carboxylesterase